MFKDENLLIQQVQQWNYEAFTPLYEAYFQKIYSFSLMKANWNVEVAQDVTAETFMKAFENIDKFSIEKSDSSFAARLYTIAYHCLLDLLKRVKVESIDEESLSWEKSDFLDYFQKHEQVEQILAYIEQLWSDKKDLFILRFREWLSYDEISTILWKRSAACRKDFSRIVTKTANHFKHRIDD